MRLADKQIFILIGFFSLLRLVVAPFFGLGVDEAHYALYARYLDLSYVDHPPLVGWIHALFFYTLGTNEFLVRLPAIILFAVTTYLAYVFILKASCSPRAALFAALALNASFMLNALGLMLLPDSILLCLVFLLIFTTDRLSSDTRARNYIWLGVLFGLAGLAKYTAVILVPAFLLFFLMRKRYDVIFTPKILLTACIGLIMILPVLYWNVTHDFISFRYQGGHVFGTWAQSLKTFTVSLAAQFGAYSPFLFIVAVYGFFKSVRHKNDQVRLAVLFGGAIMLFFLVTSLMDRTLPHWPSIFYVLFIPVGAWMLLESARKWKRYFLYVGVGGSLVLTLFIYAELAGKFIRFPDFKSPFRDIYGFSQIASAANEAMVQNTRSTPKAIAVLNWTKGSRIMYYTLPYELEVFVFDLRQDQFDIWQRGSPIGYDLLFLNTHFNHLDVERYLKCDGVEVAGALDLSLNGGRVNTAEWVWCYHYQGIKQ